MSKSLACVAVGLAAMAVACSRPPGAAGGSGAAGGAGGSGGAGGAGGSGAAGGAGGSGATGGAGGSGGNTSCTDTTTPLGFKDAMVGFAWTPGTGFLVVTQAGAFSSIATYRFFNEAGAPTGSYDVDLGVEYFPPFGTADRSMAPVAGGYVAALTLDEAHGGGGILLPLATGGAGSPVAIATASDGTSYTPVAVRRVPGDDGLLVSAVHQSQYVVRWYGPDLLPRGPWLTLPGPLTTLLPDLPLTAGLLESSGDLLLATLRTLDLDTSTLGDPVQLDPAVGEPEEVVPFGENVEIAMNNLGVFRLERHVVKAAFALYLPDPRLARGARESWIVSPDRDVPDTLDAWVVHEDPSLSEPLHISLPSQAWAGAVMADPLRLVVRDNDGWALRVICPW